MKPILFCFLAILLVSCKSTTYFVVRHAEKAEGTMAADMPLSEAGKQRAEALKEVLKKKKVGTIYTTNYIRTKSTAQPLADQIGTTIQTYDPKDSTFIRRIVKLGKKDKEGNILIVGHSNTVDDIVNQLMGEKVVDGDLADSQYGDLYVVKQKGNKFSMQHKHFGP
jgi:phosphohistidine phosphatase SixA